MAYIEETSCCGLPHLIASNEDTKTRILNAIDEYLNDGHYDYNNNCIDKNSAPHAYWCITCPNEKKLETILKRTGFVFKFDFNRRKMYGKGKLKYWLLEV